jgi:hypothetical protein
MGLRSDTHRCRVLAYGVERSSCQSKCGTQGRPLPILDSARGVHSTPGTGGVGSPPPPGVGIDDLSALHTLAQRQGWASRPVSDGRQKVSARHWNTWGLSTPVRCAPLGEAPNLAPCARTAHTTKQPHTRVHDGGRFHQPTFGSFYLERLRIGTPLSAQKIHRCGPAYPVDFHMYLRPLQYTRGSHMGK